MKKKEKYNIVLSLQSQIILENSLIEYKISLVQKEIDEALKIKNKKLFLEKTKELKQLQEEFINWSVINGKDPNFA